MAFIPDEDLKSIQKTLTHMWAEEEPDSDDEASDDDQAMAATKAFWQSDGEWTTLNSLKLPMKDEKISDIITTTASVLYARMTEDQTVQPAWRSIQDFIEAGTVDILESYRDGSKHVIGAALYDRHADLLRQKYNSAEPTDQTAIDQNQAAIMFWNKSQSLYRKKGYKIDNDASLKALETCAQACKVRLSKLTASMEPGTAVEGAASDFKDETIKALTHSCKKLTRLTDAYNEEQIAEISKRIAELRAPAHAPLPSEDGIGAGPSSPSLKRKVDSEASDAVFKRRGTEDTLSPEIRANYTFMSDLLDGATHIPHKMASKENLHWLLSQWESIADRTMYEQRRLLPRISAKTDEQRSRLSQLREWFATVGSWTEQATQLDDAIQTICEVESIASHQVSGGLGDQSTENLETLSKNLSVLMTHAISIRDKFTEDISRSKKHQKLYSTKLKMEEWREIAPSIEEDITDAEASVTETDA